MVVILSFMGRSFSRYNVRYTREKAWRQGGLRAVWAQMPSCNPTSTTRPAGMR